MEVVTLNQAKEQGLVRYFTGESCKRGHLVERLVSTRACVTCKVMHKLRWQKDNPEKHQAYNIAKAAEWREENRDRHRAKSREIYWRNPAKPREREKERWKSDSSTRERAKLRKATPEYKTKAVARAIVWAKANPGKARAAIRDWMNRHPEKLAQYARNRRARENNAVGSHASDDVREIFRMQKGMCAYCRVSLKKVRTHEDHITALSRGGSNDRSNLQILCKPCNLTKSARDPIEFGQSLGRLL